MLSRRLVLKGSMAMAGAFGFSAAGVQAAAVADPMASMQIPPQAASEAKLAALPGTRLWYSDTGGTGTPIVLLHPATGSSEIWGYQQPVLAAAGYRVIAYSRRGYFKSDSVPRDNPGTASGDLANLLDVLKIQKCHIAASAAGCQIAFDFALSNPARLHSMVLACGVGGIVDEDYAKLAERIRLPGFDAMPAEFRELSPSYRAANPQGTAAWAALERVAVTGNRFGQMNANRISWAALEKLNLPVLLIGGDADLAVAPPMLRAIQSHLPNAELMFVPEAGHSVYWETPGIFNRALLAFFARHAP